MNCARCPWNQPTPETAVDVDKLMRTVSWLDAGFAVPIDSLTPREEAAFWTVRDELRQQARRRERR